MKMETYDDVSFNSDNVDSEIEEKLYSKLYHEANPVCNTLVQTDSENSNGKKKKKTKSLQRKKELKKKEVKSMKISEQCNEFTEVSLNSSKRADKEVKSMKISKQCNEFTEDSLNSSKRAYEEIDQEDSKYHFNKKMKLNCDVFKATDENENVQNHSSVDICDHNVNGLENKVEISNGSVTKAKNKNIHETIVIVSEGSESDSCHTKKNRSKKKKRASSESSVENFNDHLETNVSINVCNNYRLSGDEKESFNVDSLQKSMSDSNWDVSFEDTYSKVRRNKRYFVNDKSRYIRCNNCNEKGHLSKVCPKPRKLLICHICGENGHHVTRCRNIVCSVCNLSGHIAKNCKLLPYLDNMVCELCSYQGHTETDCPDLWRRYHITTKNANPHQTDIKWNENMQCYNCCSNQHFGFECRQRRMDAYHLPQYQGIISYQAVDKVPPNKAKHNDQYQIDIPVKRKKKKSLLKKLKKVIDFPRRKVKNIMKKNESADIPDLIEYSNRKKRIRKKKKKEKFE